MPTQKKYRFFLGANSPEGFVSFFDHLIDLDAANEVYIIKGGRRRQIVIYEACCRRPGRSGIDGRMDRLFGRSRFTGRSGLP